jgi:perosamine synthetase
MSDKRLYGNELKYLKEVLDTGFRASHGASMMQRFESAFAERFGVKHGIACVNGTATMHAALEAWGIGEGDEVIVPPMTMASTTFAVLQSNATPVFADIDPETFQICAKSIKNRITTKTRAIIPVALFGLSPDLDVIMQLARQNNIKVLEDNAETFLGKYKGNIVGTMGDCASFSFQNSKHLTSGEGGIVITNDDDLADNIRRIVSLGYAGVSAKSGKVARETIQHPNYERHVTAGWNYRMPELCCAVALAQVENIDALVQKRINAGKIFEEVIVSQNGPLTTQKIPKHCEHSYWTVAAYLNTDDLSWDDFRNKFREFGGDGVYACWKLTYDEPFFKNKAFLGREKYLTNSFNADKSCPNAEWLQSRLFLFKTNYWDQFKAEKQADILSKTIKYFL